MKKQIHEILANSSVDQIIVTSGEQLTDKDSRINRQQFQHSD